MEQIISKELLSEVLGINVMSEIREDDLCEDNILIYWDFFEKRGNEGRNINIYELAHKCKEWAYRYGCEIASYKIQDSSEYRCLIGHNTINFNSKKSGYYADTEPGAIFKACQWVLDNKDKQCF